MEIQVRDLRDAPLDAKINMTPDQLELQDEEFSFTTPVTGEVRFMMAGDSVVATGELHTVADSICVRCLKPVQVPLDARLSVMYEDNKELLKPDSRFLGTEDEAVAYYNGEVLVPDNEFREALMVELPNITVCSEECRGLCPQCGADLNTEECRCETRSESDGVWKNKLKEIKLKD